MPPSGVLRDLQAGGGSGQRREEGGEPCPVFPGLPRTLPTGFVLS